VYGDWPPVAVTDTVLVLAFDEHDTVGPEPVVKLTALLVALHVPLPTTTV
jgi:hypothetical protein